MIDKFSVYSSKFEYGHHTDPQKKNENPGYKINYKWLTDITIGLVPYMGTCFSF